MSYHYFLLLLSYLYSGEFSIFSNHRSEGYQEMREIARQFRCTELEGIYRSLLNSGNSGSCHRTNSRSVRRLEAERFENQRKARLRRLLAESHHSDVTFTLENGDRVHCHKSLLSIRCSVLATMFGGCFAEGQSGTMSVVPIEDISPEAFHSFLEYLYTDDVDFNSTDLAGLMVLADRYDVTRLQQLCEEKLASYIWESLGRVYDQPGAVLDLEREMDFTLAELITFAKEHNAKQLEAYCNHLMAVYPQHFHEKAETGGEDAPEKGKGKGKGKEKGQEEGENPRRTFKADNQSCSIM